MKKLFSIGLTAVLLFAACSNTGPAQTNVTESSEAELKKVKLAVIAPMSGDAAVYGQEIQRILDHQIGMVNQKASNKGYEFELLYEDGKCDGKASTQAFQKVTDIDGVQFVIGGVCSSESLGIAPLLESKNVVALSGWSSSPELENKSSHFFTMSYNDNLVSEEAAKELSKYKKIALITELNDYNVAMREGVLKKLGPDVEVVADEEFVKGGSDFRNQLQKIKASGADALFINPNGGVTATSLARQIAEISDWNIDKVSIFTFMTDEIAALAPEALDGTLIVDTAKVDEASFNAILDEIVAQQGSLDNIGSFYSATTIDLLSLYTDLIIDKDADPSAVREGLAGGSFFGHMGRIQFGVNSFAEGIQAARYVFRDGKIEQL